MKNIFSIFAFFLSVISLSVVGTLYVKRDDIIRHQILENPEVITEATTLLTKRNMASRLEKFKTPLNTPFYNGYAGNSNADVTIVELSDYNCGYCRQSLADIEKLLNEDENLRVIYKETPVLADTSQTAALWSLAAAKQGKSREFHNMLFNSGGTDDDNIALAAKNAELNIEQANVFIQSEEAKNEIKQNLAIMQQVGLSGTPTFIVGDEILEGAVGYDALKAAIGRAREEISA